MIGRAAALTLAIALAAGPAHAALSGPEAARERARLEQRLKRSMLERNIGWTVTAVGLLTVATGAVLAAIRPLYPDFDTGAAYLVGGSIAAGVGAAVAIAGAAAALHGQNSMTDLGSAIERLTPRRLRPVAMVLPGGGLIGACGNF